jgi:hypothetical protein
MNSPAALGRHVLRDFGRHGFHKGLITSYDDDGELTFRVDYVDGDQEDLFAEDVEATLVALTKAQLAGTKRLIRVSGRSRRIKGTGDSESDYFEEDSHSDNSQQGNSEIPTISQATTQTAPPDLVEPSQPENAVITSTRSTTSRRRSVPSARDRSTSSLWIPSVCPLTIRVHYNAVDRGLCSQTLREHHTVLERAMGRVFPRFKWGKVNYLQVHICVLQLSKGTDCYLILMLLPMI